jgi:hypothetical protein
MAQSERFYFWRGYYDALKKLPDAESRDAFVMAICRYAFDNEEPDFEEDRLLDFAWSLVADQVHESVEIGRKMAERGRRSGESRRGKKDGTNSVRNSVRNEEKGTEVTGTVGAGASLEGSAPAPDGDSDEY